MAPPLPEPLFIDAVFHWTFINVHEGGTEAAAATAIGPAILGAGPPIDVRFIVDRPFFFAIRDNETKTVLFMGVVMEP